MMSHKHKLKHVTILTDGATLPNWYRKYIRKKYGEEILYKIDYAGFYHDYYADNVNVSKKWARRDMVIRMRLLEVPEELIKQINFGLWCYDVLFPTPIKQWVRGGINKNYREEDILIYDGCFHLPEGEFLLDAYCESHNCTSLV